MGLGLCVPQVGTFSLVRQVIALFRCDYKYYQFVSINKLVTQHTLTEQSTDFMCLGTLSTELGLRSACITRKTLQNKYKM